MRFTVAWNATGAGNIGAIVQGTLGTFGSVTSPAALAPGAGQVPLLWNLAGYYAVCLGDIHPFAGDSYEQFREYRIRKVTYTFTPRQAAYVTNPGSGNFTSGPDGTEVMIVNTSKTGQFVMPYPLNMVVPVTATHEDYPWYQVLNYPSHRNIAKVYRMSSQRPRTIRLTVDPTEDCIVQQVSEVANVGPSTGGLFAGDPFAGGVDPQRQAVEYYGANSANTLLPRLEAGRFQMRRRRFRWTRQWLIWESSVNEIPQMLYVRNDLKRAHGCQFMVKPGTYWQCTVPYYNVSINVSVEFRGRLLQQLSGATQYTSQVLFPYTNATFSTVA